jgi:hypothetical protein
MLPVDPKRARPLGVLYPKPDHLGVRPPPLQRLPQGGLFEILEHLGRKEPQQLAHYLSEQ